MLKVSKKTGLLLSIVAGLLVIAVLAGVTGAYLSDRRTYRGYFNFSNGILIQADNVSESADSESFGNLKHFNETNQLTDLEINNIGTDQTINLANPKFTALENTASFIIRSKILITDLVTHDKYIFGTNSANQYLVETFQQNVEFDYSSRWLPDNDGWFYYCKESTESVSASNLQIVNEGDSSFYVFNGGDIIAVTTLSAVESLGTQGFTIELFVEALEASDAGVTWNPTFAND